MTGGGTIMCQVLSVHVHTHRSNNLLCPHGTLTDVKDAALCFILYRTGKPVWFLQLRVYGLLPLRGTGFDASSRSVLHIKGQLFYSWKTGETLNFFTTPFRTGL